MRANRLLFRSTVYCSKNHCLKCSFVASNHLVAGVVVVTEDVSDSNKSYGGATLSNGGVSLTEDVNDSNKSYGGATLSNGGLSLTEDVNDSNKSYGGATLSNGGVSWITD